MEEKKTQKDCFRDYRAFGREGCGAVSIRFARYDSPGDYAEGTMYNRGVGGLYFETDRLLPPATDIYIRTINDASEVHGKGEELYRAHVMRCRKIDQEDADLYGVGVRFLINVCSECEDTIPYDRINRTADHLHLCPACADKLNSLQEGSLKSCIEEYLLGNVI